MFFPPKNFGDPVGPPNPAKPHPPNPHTPANPPIESCSMAYLDIKQFLPFAEDVVVFCPLLVLKEICRYQNCYMFSTGRKNSWKVPILQNLVTRVLTKRGAERTFGSGKRFAVCVFVGFVFFGGGRLRAFSPGLQKFGFASIRLGVPRRRFWRCSAPPARPP